MFLPITDNRNIFKILEWTYIKPPVPMIHKAGRRVREREREITLVMCGYKLMGIVPTKIKRNNKRKVSPKSAKLINFTSV